MRQALSRLHRHRWARLLRLVLACMLAASPSAHSLAMTVAAEQAAQAMPCHQSETGDPSKPAPHAGCHCGNAIQCTCAMAPALPAIMSPFSGGTETSEYLITHYSLSTHLLPAPELPPPRL